jgi:hypothetical protein
MTHEMSHDQPLFDLENPADGRNAPVDPAKRAETAAQIAEVSRRFSYEQRTSEAFADLGGGTSTTDSEELDKPVLETDQPAMPDSDEHQEWITGLNLSLPTSEFPTIPRKTAEEKAASSAHAAVVRAQIKR